MCSSFMLPNLCLSFAAIGSVWYVTTLNFLALRQYSKCSIPHSIGRNFFLLHKFSFQLALISSMPSLLLLIRLHSLVWVLHLFPSLMHQLPVQMAYWNLNEYCYVWIYIFINSLNNASHCSFQFVIISPCPFVASFGGTVISE